MDSCKNALCDTVMRPPTIERNTIVPFNNALRDGDLHRLRLYHVNKLSVKLHECIMAKISRAKTSAAPFGAAFRAASAAASGTAPPSTYKLQEQNTNAVRY